MYVCYVEGVCPEISSQLNKTLMATFQPAYAMFIVFLSLMFYLASAGLVYLINVASCL